MGSFHEAGAPGGGEKGSVGRTERKGVGWGKRIDLGGTRSMKKQILKKTKNIENIKPEKMKSIKDKDGKIVKLISGQTTYISD